MSERLDDLKGIGPKTIGWLREAGIDSVEDLRSLGAAAAYRRLRFVVGSEVSRNALWGLHGALSGCAWNAIAPETKARLLREAGED
ncbi:TfoX/Sxy family protein [Oryzibacter oryziterrae]|uniref:TfoX/Sxy family protein n=1 Tax=Oryzibacter oryziterrae TaxID=2766474 RepID=UPI001F1DD764|nr:TfoX/Sxy family protein [Oryzibacter oryziterrae]